MYSLPPPSACIGALAGVKITREWSTIGLYPIPSLIYLVHNNIQFYTLKYLDPNTYQILGNLKIVTTGILFRLFLKVREGSIAQHLARSVVHRFVQTS